MTHVRTRECEAGEEFLCQYCDEAFFHFEEEEPVCPKCGISGSEWLLSLSLEEDEDQQRTESNQAGSR